MHVALVTAGGAGMFCGSCMLDNAWARALHELGVQVSLVPTYSPIRVDEPDASLSEVFLGGLNLYLEHRWPWWRRVPAAVRRPLDSPWLLSAVGRRAVGNQAAQLGELTVELLRGEQGLFGDEVDRLCRFLAGDLRPDLVCFSNCLLAGVVPALRSRYDGPVLCLLQGDDIFVQALPEPFRTETLRRLRTLAKSFDALLVHSRFYEEFVSEWLQVPRQRLRRLPLGLHLCPHVGRPAERGREPFRLGYFARVCPEKGLHVLVDAYVRLLERGVPVQLHVGGYLRPSDRRYLRELERKARRAGGRLNYAGSPDTVEQKVEFLRRLHALSVPTTYREPKGLYVLEAWANGVPVVQPAHGSFPELVGSTGGGLLVSPEDPASLADAVQRLVEDEPLRLQLARRGHEGVRRLCSVERTAERGLQLFRQFAKSARSS